MEDLSEASGLNQRANALDPETVSETDVSQTLSLSLTGDRTRSSPREPRARAPQPHRSSHAVDHTDAKAEANGTGLRTAHS